MYTYILECYNPYSNRYEDYGEYTTIERAEIMFNKPYFRTRTRRLIIVSKEILYKEKGKLE
jgi:hypothetical protein